MAPTASGMPHFENSFATRGAPLLSASAIRDTTGRDHLNWADIERIRQRWHGNLVIKGILHKSDAERAVALGADGIIVSNRGGCQLDGAVESLAVLPEICESVGHKTTVMMDSGIRRGGNVLKALALAMLGVQTVDDVSSLSSPIRLESHLRHGDPR